MINDLKVHKFSKNFGEVFWPGVGYIAVNGADHVLGSVTYSASGCLRDMMKIDPKAFVDVTNSVEAVADTMFPGIPGKWVWMIHADLQDLMWGMNN